MLQLQIMYELQYSFNLTINILRFFQFICNSISVYHASINYIILYLEILVF